MKSKDEAILEILYDELSYAHLLEGNFELSLKYSNLLIALNRPGQETNLYLSYPSCLNCKLTFYLSHSLYHSFCPSKIGKIQ